MYYIQSFVQPLFGYGGRFAHYISWPFVTKKHNLTKRKKGLINYVFAINDLILLYEFLFPFCFVFSVPIDPSSSASCALTCYKGTISVADLFAAEKIVVKKSYNNHC